MTRSSVTCDHSTYAFQHQSPLVARGIAWKSALCPTSTNPNPGKHFADSDNHCWTLQNLALALHPNLDASIQKRLVCETHATDSYQNLLFSLNLFVRQTSCPPTHITIISHAFKRERFLKLHCKAVRWPLEKVSYMGIDPDFDEDGRRAADLGNAKALKEWGEDLYGVGESLAEKRRKRGWNGRSKIEVAHGLDGLMAWGGGESGREIFGGPLPWNE